MTADLSAARRRAEVQYLDIVDYILNHPNIMITGPSYLEWSKRDTSIDWGEYGAEGAVRSRLQQIATSVLLPYRPELPAASRNALWLSELLRAEGTFYRVTRGTYVLDTAARWRRTARGVVLADNRWSHFPPARVREAMPDNTPRRSPPNVATPVAEPVAEPAPPTEALSAPRPVIAAAAPEPVVSYSVEAAGGEVGAQIVLRRVDPTGSTTLLLAQVTSVIDAVTT